MFDKRIVTIHDVATDTLTPKRLRRYLKWIQRIGYKFVPIDQLLNEKKQKKLITLTIDDAYSSTISETLTILEEFNITALLFVPTGLLNRPKNDQELLVNDCYRNKSTMTWNDLRVWIEHGQQIGFHTDKHLDLFHSSNELIEKDFTNGMKALHEKGINTPYFAYPKGFLPQDRLFFESLLKKNNIKYAFTINHGKVDSVDRYYINRVCLGNNEPLFWSILKTIGATDRFFYKKRQHPEQKI